MHTSVSVIVPIYKKELTPLEEIALRQCFRILSDYPVIALKPKSLPAASLPFAKNFSALQSFEDHFFKGRQGYSQMMLSSRFYERFSDFEFMLIYQLDAFVFKDELSNWCKSGYEYIGAPWLYPFSKLPPVERGILKTKSNLYRFLNLRRNGLPRAKQLIHAVGNGGFSLRRTESFFSLARKYKNMADSFLRNEAQETNEDVFWSIELNRRKRRLKIPHYKIASEFALETYPEEVLSPNSQQLPFGCHAWDKHLDFWRPHIKKYGYNI